MRIRYSIKLLLLITILASLLCGWIAHVRSMQRTESAAMEFVQSLRSDPEFALEENPFWLRHCGFEKHVTRVNLTNSEVTDEQLLVLDRFSHLREVRLMSTPITARGLQLVKPSSTWTDLVLWNSRAIDDTAMRELEKFPSLTYLHLAQTGITDAGLEHVGRLKNLEVLVLSYTHIRGSGLAHLAGLPKLQELWLDSSDVEDEGIKAIASIASLRMLSLEGTRISDQGIEALAGSPLEELWLGWTKVTDASLSSLKKMTTLDRLRLEHTRITSDSIRDLQETMPKTNVFGWSRPD